MKRAMENASIETEQPCGVYWGIENMLKKILAMEKKREVRSEEGEVNAMIREGLGSQK